MLKRTRDPKMGMNLLGTTLSEGKPLLDGLVFVLLCMSMNYIFGVLSEGAAGLNFCFTSYVAK